MAFHITLFLYVFGLFIKNSGQFFWDTPEAELLPTDSLVFVGETLRMKCTPPEGTSTNLSLVRFTIYNQNDESWMLPEEDHVVDGLTVLINITVTQNFTESTTVTCIDEKKQPLRRTFIYAESPIESIQNFSAVYLYNENISLSWNWAMKNKTDVNISVTLSGSNTFNENDTFPCPSVTMEGCVLPSSKYFGQPYLYVSITLTALRWNKRPDVTYLSQVFNTSVTSFHSVYIFNNTKSGPPEHLTVMSKNSTCFTLSWKNPAYISYCSVCSRFYAIKVQKVGEAPDGPGEEIYQNEGVPYQGPTLSLCVFEPFTEYQVTLRVKREEVTPWSNPSTISFRTAEDRPLNGPPVLNTNYYVKECVSNKRQVYIYWQAPPKTMVRGELTEFKIIFNNQTYKIRKESNYFLNEIECLSESNVFIYTVNSIGESIEPSKIVVPASQTDFSDKLEFKVEEIYHNTSTTLKNMTITWNSGPLKNDNATLLIYRCEEYYIANTCFYDFKVEEVNLSQQSLSLENLNFRENFFGFALKFGNNEKKGIIWTECVFSKEAEPLKPVGVQVAPGSEENSLFISWLATPCDRKTKVLIQYYVVYICPTTDSINGCFSQQVSSTTKNLTARSLPRNGDFYVSIRAVSPYLEGKLSEPKLATIKPNVKDSALNGIIIAVCLSLGVVIVIIGFVILLRKCDESRERIKRLIEKEDAVSCDGSNNTTQDTVSCDGSKNTTYTVVTINSDKVDTETPVYDLPNTDNSIVTNNQIAYSRMSSGSESTSQDACSEYQTMGYQSSGTQTEVVSHDGSSHLPNNAGNESVSFDLNANNASSNNLQEERGDGSLIGDDDEIGPFTREIDLEAIQVEANSNIIQVVFVAQETSANKQQIESLYDNNQSNEDQELSNEENQSTNEDNQNNQEYISNEETSQPVSDYVRECQC